MDEISRKKSLRRSIAYTITAYLAIQYAVFTAFALPAGFFGRFWLEFFLVSAGFHAILGVLLLFFIEDFVKESTGEVLASINLANRITLVRVSTLPTLLYLVIAAKSYKIRFPLLFLVVAIFVTDFLDGYISRKSKQITRIGRMMDSASDYCLLIVLTLVFSYYKLIPIWFLILVLTRLGTQVALVAILIIIQKRIEPRTTFMGKLAIASIMVGYSFEVFELIVGGMPPMITTVIEWLVAAILVASIGDKIVSFVSCLGKAKKKRRIENGADKKRA